MIGDALPRATRDGTSPTGLSGSRGEPQGVGATSSGGSYSTVMLCIHPVQGPGANGPVAGGPPGRYYGPENPIILSDIRVGKGLIECVIESLVSQSHSVSFTPSPASPPYIAS